MPVPAYPHFILNGRGRALPYTYPRTVAPAGTERPSRDRYAHGHELRDAFGSIKEELREQWEARDHSADFGACVEFAGEIGYALEVDKLDLRRSGIEIVNTRIVVTPGDGPENERTTRFATAFIPYSKISLFIRKIDAYLTQEGSYRDRRTGVTRSTGPKNASLVESISQVRIAVLNSFWTDNSATPDPNEPRWWEIWIRSGTRSEQREQNVQRFILNSDAVGIRIEGQPLYFPEQTVLLAYGTGRSISESPELLSCLAELRCPATTAGFFAELSNIEAQDWVRELAHRTTIAANDAPSVCLLDTGINREHPLLERSTVVENCDTAVGGDSADIRGHGTQMAGLALLGDLTEALSSREEIHLTHHLESIKILPDPPHENEPKNWGNITKESVYRSRTNSPNRTKVFNLSIGALEGRNGGKPSAWSTALDQIAVGEEGQPKQLIIVAAGNATKEEPNCPLDYPRANRRLAIHNPAQAWNALTVGSFAHKDRLSSGVNGIVPAPRGAMSPCNSTSLIWDNQWPLKPDVVCEGGNHAIIDGLVDLADDLQITTTGHDFRNRPLALTGDTSASAALASRMAAQIFSRYPDAWPETIRALMVQFADWTPAMLNNRSKWSLIEAEKRELLRQVGYGVPNLNKAIEGARTSVTLIYQDELQPFRLVQGGDVKTMQFNRHDLPWPKRELEALMNTEVTLHVTLSYFIEPNPGPRDVSDKYRYASAGLRFDLQRAAETPVAFARRTSRDIEVPSTESSIAASDTGSWLIGRTKHRGSIHRDSWRGRAIDLAARSAIHVFPVTGWWRYRKHLNRTDDRIRYALIVSIETPPETPEIHSLIGQQIQVPTEIPTLVSN